jgi:hypothetical protein
MNILRLMMDTSHFSLQQGKVVQPLQKACKDLAFNPSWKRTISSNH